MLFPYFRRHLPGFSPAIALRKFHKRHYSKRIPHNTEDLFQISESHPEKHKLHEKLIAENTRVDTTSDMPRILYRPGLGIRKRLHVMRLMLRYHFKPLAPHVGKHLTACEKMLAMINETISNKIPVPFVHAHTIQELSRKVYGNGAPRKEKVLHIVVGPAGSGKSSRKVMPLQEEYGAMVIDSDHVKPHLPNYLSGYGGVAVHPASMEVTFKVLKRAFENGDNIVYPTTGGDLARMKQFIEQARKYGYKVGLHLVDLPVEEAVQRAVQRSAIKENGHFQYVSPDYVVDVVGIKPRLVFHDIVDQNLVDEHSHITTSRLKKGEAPTVIAQSPQKISDLLKETKDKDKNTRD